MFYENRTNSLRFLNKRHVIQLMSENYIDYMRKNSKFIIIGTALLGALLIGGVMTQLSGNSSGNYENNRQLATSSGADRAYDSPTNAESDIPPTKSDGGDPDVAEKKEIITYNIEFKVQNVNSALESTGELAGDYGGWTDSQRYNTGKTNSGHITVRIPTQNVSSFLQDTENSWKLESKNQDKRDVTSRYTELSLELENKRQELKRLEGMMNRTNDVDNLIKVQERMSEIRSRVQYLENEMEGIDEKVDYTEIRIGFEEPESFTAEFELRETFSNAFRGIFESLKLIVVGTGYLLPFALIAAAIHYARRALKQRD